jgi:hypothetical protein
MVFTFVSEVDRVLSANVCVERDSERFRVLAGELLRFLRYSFPDFGKVELTYTSTHTSND